MGDEIPTDLQAALDAVTAVYLRAASERLPPWANEHTLATDYVLLAAQAGDTLRLALDVEQNVAWVPEPDQLLDHLRSEALDTAVMALRLLVRARGGL